MRSTAPYTLSLLLLSLPLLPLLATSTPTETEAPCDIYANAGTPCVAAHSLVRALYAKYTGALYQLKRTADGALKDISVLTAAASSPYVGYADSAAQDAFCGASGTGACSVHRIYDQSPMGNHLSSFLPAANKSFYDPIADKAPVFVAKGGHKVYGLFVEGVTWQKGGFYKSNGFRNDTATGLATGNEPESM
jgi:hypothetical protein